MVLRNIAQAPSDASASLAEHRPLVGCDQSMTPRRLMGEFQLVAPLLGESTRQRRSFIKLMSSAVANFAPDERKRAQTEAIGVKRWPWSMIT
jgi:hypothetical protein